MKRGLSIWLVCAAGALVLGATEADAAWPNFLRPGNKTGKTGKTRTEKAEKAAAKSSGAKSAIKSGDQSATGETIADARQTQVASGENSSSNSSSNSGGNSGNNSNNNSGVASRRRERSSAANPNSSANSSANTASFDHAGWEASAGVLKNQNTPEVFDSLVAQWYERQTANVFEQYFRDFIDLDNAEMPTSEVPDSVYISRLKMIVSPIHLGFNDIVKSRILAYTRGKGTMSKILGLSQLYFPMIEQELAAHNLPIELRMLPVIESALNPVAVSRMGATGLWQFMYGTGKAYGLEITSFVDQRRDPVASTHAACRFLKDLYRMYGDWTLAIAAYNCGPGNVNKALKRAGDNASNFWDVYPYLPRETRGYVPAFIAATYAYNFHRQHDIEPRDYQGVIATDTIHVSRLMHFEQVATNLATPIEVLRELNPQYKMDIIPSVENKSYKLTLPQSDVARYLALEEQIHACDTVYLAQYLKRDAKTNEAEFQINSVEYRIKSGDTLGAIAGKYGVTVSQLMKWNNIKNANTLRIGQRIEIYK